MTTVTRSPARSLTAGFLVALVVAAVVAGCGKPTTRRALSTSGTSSSSVSAGTSIVDARSTPGLGMVLVDDSGMTLYRNTAEAGGTTACTGGCASLWPPLLAPADGRPLTPGAGATGTLGTVTRPDGGKQVTYNGLALYRYSNDHQPGDTNGQGVGGVWFAVAPTDSLSSPPTTQVARAGTSAPTTVTTRGAAPTVPPARPAPTVPRTTTPPATAPATTSPPATSPPTTAPPTTAYHPPTTICYYPPCH